MRIQGYGKFSHFYQIAWSEDWAARVRDGVIRTVERGVKGKSLRILDVACGAGHVAAALAERGHRVVGIDGSAALLRAARKIAPGGEFHVWRFGEKIPVSEKFDAAICLYDSLNHAADSTTVQHILSEISRVLKPGGILLFDYNAVRGFAKRWQFTVRIDRSWGWCETRLSYDAARRRGIVDSHGMVRGKRFRERYEEMPFTEAQVREWLSVAGLKTTPLLDSLLGVLPGEHGRVWVLARKKRL